MNQQVLPVLPKISLRLLIGVVTLSAVSMAIIQHAWTSESTWATVTMAAIFATLVPFLFYAGAYSLAGMFSSVGQVAAGPGSEKPVHTPTMVMPTADAIPETPEAGDVDGMGEAKENGLQ